MLADHYRAGYSWTTDCMCGYRRYFLWRSGNSGLHRLSNGHRSVRQQYVVPISDSTFLGVCEGEKIIYRTWTAIDSCDNEGESCEQVINVRCVSCVEIEKIVSDSAQPTGNKNEWVIEYRLAVWNPSIFGITYDLTDTLMYGDGVNVVSAVSAYVGGDGQQGTPGVFIGDVGLISDDEMLGPDANDTFSVRVVYTIDLDVLDEDEADCSLTTGSPDGTGLMNSGVVIHPTITVRDTVCVNTPYPILFQYQGKLLKMWS